MNIKNSTKPCKKCLKGIRLQGRTICISCYNKEQRQKIKLQLEKKKLKRNIKKEKNQESFKYLHKVAWILMSKYVRLKGADKDEFNTCYTCGVKLHYKELQAGHFHHGRLDFDERNLKPQCSRCNKYLSGNLAVYAINLMNQYGIDWLNKLSRDSYEIKYSCDDLKRIIKELKEKLSCG